MLQKISERPLVAAALILGGALAIAALVLGLFFGRIKGSTNLLTSTGSAKVSVTSDLAKLNGSFARTVAEGNLQDGFRQMASDKARVEAFLVASGFTTEEYTISPVSFFERYDYNSNGQAQPKRFDLTQRVTIESTDLEKVTNLANTTADIINQGVIFQSSDPQYFYNDLATLRVDLLSDAIGDAKERAGQIAKGAGQRVGKLVSASSGVVQVLAPNSLEVSDYGSYDTSTIEKDVMVTVRATFKVK